MSRRKADPLEAALDAFHALDPAQQVAFHQVVWHVKRLGAVPGMANPIMQQQPRRGRPPKLPKMHKKQEQAVQDALTSVGFGIGRDAAATGEGL